jgi:hypothetical protein
VRAHIVTQLEIIFFDNTQLELKEQDEEKTLHYILIHAHTVTQLELREQDEKKALHYILIRTNQCLHHCRYK